MNKDFKAWHLTHSGYFKQLMGLHSTLKRKEKKSQSIITTITWLLLIVKFLDIQRGLLHFLTIAQNASWRALGKGFCSRGGYGKGKERCIAVLFYFKQYCFFFPKFFFGLTREKERLWFLEKEGVGEVGHRLKTQKLNFNKCRGSSINIPWDSQGFWERKNGFQRRKFKLLPLMQCETRKQANKQTDKLW